MALSLLLICLAGYLVMTAVFLTCTQGASRRVRWLGFISIAVSAPFFYWLGAFSGLADSGLCYSSVIDRVANAVEQTDSPKVLAKQLKALPMRGYETSCREVEQATHQLPGSAP